MPCAPAVLGGSDRLSIGSSLRRAPSLSCACLHGRFVCLSTILPPAICRLLPCSCVSGAEGMLRQSSGRPPLTIPRRLAAPLAYPHRREKSFRGRGEGPCIELQQSEKQGRENESGGQDRATVWNTLLNPQCNEQAGGKRRGDKRWRGQDVPIGWCRVLSHTTSPLTLLWLATRSMDKASSYITPVAPGRLNCSGGSWRYTPGSPLLRSADSPIPAPAPPTWPAITALAVARDACDGVCACASVLAAECEGLSSPAPAPVPATAVPLWGRRTGEGGLEGKCRLRPLVMGKAHLGGSPFFLDAARLWLCGNRIQRLPPLICATRGESVQLA